ncbi:MAG: CGNR zinc finger domain-containing protein [Marinibacterium sp.]|nr:CGNR zinc finger domain-containing protein [Marinibacterium sp.]
MWSDDNFVGGHIALDFLNTVGDTGKSRSNNLLTSPEALMEWFMASGAQDEDTDDNWPSQEDVDALVSFRELTHRVFSASLGNTTGEPGDVQRFESQIKSSLRRAHLHLSAAPVRWVASGRGGHYWMDQFVLLVEGFIRAPEATKLRQCEGCSWFFLNSGRGRGRRWCNMSTCGNRNKVAAHRKRLSADDHG